MRPTRVLLAVSAAALVATACGDDSTAGSGSPAAASGSAAPTSAAPTSSAAAGGDTAALEGSEILARAKAAFKKADSVRLVGGGTSDGESFTVDMHYSAAGEAIGTVGSGGRKIELRRLGQTVYLKADQAFWTQTAGAQVARVLADKYLKAPLTDARVAQLASFTDKDAFVEEVLEAGGTVTKSGAKEIRGVPAIGLLDSSDKGGGTLYVATSGEPLPLQLAPEGGKGSGVLDFVEYGKELRVEVPPAAETIDVTKLGR